MNPERPTRVASINGTHVAGPTPGRRPEGCSPTAAHPSWRGVAGSEPPGWNAAAADAAVAETRQIAGRRALMPPATRPSPAGPSPDDGPEAGDAHTGVETRATEPQSSRHDGAPSAPSMLLTIRDVEAMLQLGRKRSAYRQRIHTGKCPL